KHHTRSYLRQRDFCNSASPSASVRNCKWQSRRQYNPYQYRWPADRCSGSPPVQKLPGDTVSNTVHNNWRLWNQFRLELRGLTENRVFYRKLLQTANLKLTYTSLIYGSSQII